MSDMATLHEQVIAEARAMLDAAGADRCVTWDARPAEERARRYGVHHCGTPYSTVKVVSRDDKGDIHFQLDGACPSCEAWAYSQREA